MAAICLLAQAPGVRAALSETHFPSSVLVGGKLSFTFTLSGLGTTPGIFTNQFPPGAVFVSANVTNGTFTVSNNTFWYTPATTPASSAIVFDLVLTPVIAQVISNAAYWVPSQGSVELAYSCIPVTSVVAGPKMVVGRVEHQSTLLRDGRVLVTGGRAVVGGYVLATNCAEVYTPSNDAFSMVGDMSAARWEHTATLLTNGMVLVAGGRTRSVTNASLELFDPTNNVFTPAGNLAVPRALHTATLLSNGDVLIAGGSRASTLIERFALRNGQWTLAAAGNLTVPRQGHLAKLLPSGEILFAGGVYAPASFAEKYDPATGVSVPLGSPGRLLPAVAAAQEKVLLHGWAIQPDFGAELYDLESDSFMTVTNPPGPASGENYLVLKTGEVLVTGGYMSYAVYLFDARAATFKSSYPINISRSYHSAVELADGRVLLTGGNDIIDTMSSDMRSTEVYAIRLDRDQDGMDDSWELAHGLDPANQADAIEDPDGDGHTNLQEYLAGTDPHDPTSALRFESVQQDANIFRMRFNSVLGKYYRVQQTTNMTGGSWVNATGILAGNGRPLEVAVAISSGTENRSYRVLLLP